MLAEAWLLWSVPQTANEREALALGVFLCFYREYEYLCKMYKYTSRDYQALSYL
jgi:hypothetical protein